MIATPDEPTSRGHSHNLKQKWSLLKQLAIREIESRYRGAGLGLFWSIVTPLLSLAVYTFVFGTVFKSRWGSATETASPMEFAVILFSGLIMFQLLSEIINRAPGLIVSNSNYVKRILFPLELLIPSVAGAALFHALISLALILPFVFFVFGTIPATVVFVPIIILPFMLMLLGTGWFLASIGTFVRDIGQVIGTVTTAIMFLSPIFFPLSALPGWVTPGIYLNPLTVPIEQLRNVLIFGHMPDFLSLGLYTVASALIAVAGYYWFEKTRKGFADVV